MFASTLNARKSANFTLFRAFCFSLIFFSSSNVFAQEKTISTRIIGAEFGIFTNAKTSENNKQSADFSFAPSLQIPATSGVRYGWSIQIDTNKRSVSVREEYLIDSPNKTQMQKAPDTETNIEIILPRRQQVSQRQLVPVNGMIFGQWEIGANEPKGARHLQVIIENSATADFEFQVR